LFIAHAACQTGVRHGEKDESQKLPLGYPNILCLWTPQYVGIALGYPRKIPGITWGYPRGDLSQDVGIRWESRRVNPKTGAPQQSRFWIVGVEDVGITVFNIFTVLNLNEISKPL
jgi:hypothetical protein